MLRREDGLGSGLDLGEEGKEGIYDDLRFLGAFVMVKAMDGSQVLEENMKSSLLDMTATVS